MSVSHWSFLPARMWLLWARYRGNDLVWRLIYVLLVGAVVLTWETVRVSFGDSAPQATPQLSPSALLSHAVSLRPPDWPTAAAPDPSSKGITMVIPRLGIHAPVYDRGLDSHGVLTVAPGYAVTHFKNSAVPGSVGNYVAYGHDDIQGSIFRRLSLLHPGDTVDLYQNGTYFVYTVTTTSIVLPTAIEVLRPSSQPTMTLISCTPYMIDSRRIVVTASLTQLG